jgi:Eukaryotic initiation factor 4E
MCENNEDIYLNDVWTMYFHDPNDSDWTTSSYINIGNISTIDDFWNHETHFQDQIHKGMFFLMREHVFPYWDDPSNINGGCFSIKVLKEDMGAFWKDVCMKLLGELLVKEGNASWDVINGISTSPKKHFCIVKIWTKDASLSSIDTKKIFNIPSNYHGDLLYKSNMDNISNDSAKIDINKTE